MPGGNRHAADEVLALALARGMTVHAASALANVSDRTAHRRLLDESFRRRVKELRAEMFDRAAGQLAALTEKASEALSSALEGDPSGLTVRAAGIVFEQAAKLRQSGDFEERLAELEKGKP
jgi:hypothetical protein